MGYNSFVTVLPVAVRAIMDEDYDPDFKSNSNSEILKHLIPDIFKEYRDSIPFNVLKFILIFLSAVIMTLGIYFFPIYAFSYSSKDDTGIPFSYWDLSYCCYVAVTVIHFYIIFNDTLLYNWFVCAGYGLQLAIDILFFIVYEACNYGNELSGDIYSIMSSVIFWFVLLITIGVCILPFYIYRRFNYFFGDMIVNKIKQRRTDQLYVEKYYKKKLSQMTRATRSITKFKKIYKVENNIEYDNIADKQMKKIVDEFKEKRKKSKTRNKRNTTAKLNNINLKKIQTNNEYEKITHR